MRGNSEESEIEEKRTELVNQTKIGKTGLVDFLAKEQMLELLALNTRCKHSIDNLKPGQDRKSDRSRR